MNTTLYSWNAGLFIPYGIVYLLAAGYVLTCQRAKGRDFRILETHLFLLGVASLLQVVSMTSFAWGGVMVYALMIVSVLLLQQFRQSLVVNHLSRAIFWWGLGAIWIVLHVLTTFVWPSISLWVLLLGWLGFILQLARYVIKVYRKTTLAFSRRQMLYWITILLLVGSGQLVTFVGLPVWGNLFALLGSLMLAYVITAPQVMDFLSMARQTLATLFLMLLALFLYGLVWMFIKAAPNVQLDSLLWLPGVILLLIFVVFFRSLWRISERFVQRILPGTDFDTNRVIREYSLSVSNILDPQRLATVAIGLISEAIEVQRGVLLLVFREQMGDVNGYRLKGNTGMGIPAPPDGMLAAGSPIAAYFIQVRAPLTQYALDFNPEFSELTPEERKWFVDLDVDLYVPIYAKEDWIGLLALGAKSSGQSYLEDDLLLLRILADQTAVALQNARLVDSIMRVNNDFRRAYSAMDQSNRQLARANTQLEKLDRAKSDFIAIASHELRTPLTVMRGYTEMLQDDPMIKDNSYYGKLVSGIHNGIMRFHEIVDGMLDIAMIDNSTLNLSVNEVSMDVLIRIVCNSLKDVVSERKMNLTLENLQALPAIQGDPEALRKVFHHLLVNAVKYTPDGGDVTVSGRRLEAGEQGLSGEGVEIVVSDTGIGIQPEFHDLIFVKFYQTGEIALHSSGKTKFKGGGPGLGLTIAKGIVEAHGGRIWVESPGHDEEKCPGSKFYVALPVRVKSQ